jgi:amidase
VEEREPPALADAYELWLKQVMTELQLAVVPMIEPAASPDAVRFLRLAGEAMPALDYGGYIASFAQRNAVARAWSTFQAECPLILGPVSAQQPFPVGKDLTSAQDVLDIARALRLTVAANLLGLPAAAVPVGVAHGLPQGVQIIGPRYREDLCLDAAQAIEERLGLITPIDPVRRAPTG